MNILDRFEGKFIPEPMSGCWLWASPLNKDGYGRFKLENKSLRSHRVSYTLYNGDIPDGLCVMHTCDTPSCVNPGHLVLGTWGDNNKDRAAKGRSVSRWEGLCKRGHDLKQHARYRPSGSRYCATCNHNNRKARS